jgi:hypothetical protein
MYVVITDANRVIDVYEADFVPIDKAYPVNIHKKSQLIQDLLNHIREKQGGLSSRARKKQQQVVRSLKQLDKDFIELSETQHLIKQETLKNVKITVVSDKIDQLSEKQHNYYNVYLNLGMLIAITHIMVQEDCEYEAAKIILDGILKLINMQEND